MPTKYPTHHPTKYPTKMATIYPTDHPIDYAPHPTELHPTPYHDTHDDFELFEHMGCRTSDGKKGSKWTGQFDIFNNVSRDTCKTKCLGSERVCFGYEYSSHWKRCEVWKVHIDSIKLEYVDGLDCYIKKDVSNSRMATTMY